MKYLFPVFLGFLAFVVFDMNLQTFPPEILASTLAGMTIFGFYRFVVR